MCAVERGETGISILLLDLMCINVTESKDDVSSPLLELCEAGRLVFLTSVGRQCPVVMLNQR